MTIEEKKAYINDFCMLEYGNEGDFSDLHEVPLLFDTAYTNEGDETPFRVNVDTLADTLKVYTNSDIYEMISPDYVADVTPDFYETLDFNSLYAIGADCIA